MRELLERKPCPAEDEDEPRYAMENDYPRQSRAGQKKQSRLSRIVRANKKRLLWFAIVSAIGLSLAYYVVAPTPVDYVIARSTRTTETLGAFGRVAGERATELGLDVTGVVGRIYASEGDRVKAGAPILVVDTSEMDAAVEAARASLHAAEAELARASRPALPSEIAQARAELARSDSVGRARVAQAQARLRNLQEGSRSQEIAEAQATLRREQAVLTKAENDYRRTKELVNEGAMAAAQLDAARMELESARATVEAQRERVNLVRAGARPELVAEARAAVAEAQVSLSTSVRAARERLNSLLALPRSEDVRAARAKVDQARAELARAMTSRSRSELRAPFDGVLADLMVEAGQSVSPGQKLASLQEIARPVIEVETDEDNLSVLASGMKAVVSCDAFPGKSFQAVLYDLGSTADPDRGTIKIKLRPIGHVSWLRPNLTVDVNIITKTGARQVILPPDTLTRANGRAAVMVIRNGIATPVAVNTGAAGARGIVVRGNLKDGDVVIRNAAKVRAGDSVSLANGS